MRTVSLMTANQEFSKLIKEVEQGEGFPITRRGRVVAKLVPHTVDKTADPEWADLILRDAPLRGAPQDEAAFSFLILRSGAQHRVSKDEARSFHASMPARRAKRRRWTESLPNAAASAMARLK
jgi:prevent-host-death family protein